MKEIIYTLRCPSCDNEYAEGTKIELDSHYESINWEDAEDGLAERECDDCIWLADK